MGVLCIMRGLFICVLGNSQFVLFIHIIHDTYQHTVFSRKIRMRDLYVANWSVSKISNTHSLIIRKLEQCDRWSPEFL